MEVLFMRLPNGFGSVTKLSGNRRCPYMARVTTGWTDKGQPVRKVLGYYSSSPKAIKALSDYNENPYNLTAHNYTYAELYAEWTKDRYTDKGEKIPNSYAAAFKRSENLHGMVFADIRKRHVQGEIDNCKLGFSTKKNIKILANLLSKYAIDQEIITTNYAALAELPAAEESRIHIPFSDTELALLWANTDDIGCRLALIYCYTGFRPTELLKVRTENVHLADHVMYGGMKTAAGKNRAVPIADKILPFISDMYDTGNEYLVMDPYDGQPMLTYDRMREHAWERSEILTKHMNHLPHDGRHTCATLLDNVDTPKKIIQLILGHRAADITHRVYTHKTLQQLIDAINLI